MLAANSQLGDKQQPRAAHPMVCAQPVYSVWRMQHCC